MHLCFVCKLLVYLTKATFTLHRFHYDPFLLPKTELFSSLFTLLRFQTKTDIYQLVFTLFLKNASVFLFLTTRPSRLLILAFSNFFVFGAHTTELRFCLAPFSFSSVLSSFSFSSALGWTNVNAKPKTELSRCVFVQKRNSVNGPKTQNFQEKSYDVFMKYFCRSFKIIL